MKKLFIFQLAIKQGHFMEEEFYIILKTLKSSKAAGLDEIRLEVWKTRKFNDIFYHATLSITKTL